MKARTQLGTPSFRSAIRALRKRAIELRRTMRYERGQLRALERLWATGFKSRPDGRVAIRRRIQRLFVEIAGVEMGIGALKGLV